MAVGYASDLRPPQRFAPGAGPAPAKETVRFWAAVVASGRLGAHGPEGAGLDGLRQPVRGKVVPQMLCQAPEGRRGRGQHVLIADYKEARMRGCRRAPHMP